MKPKINGRIISVFFLLCLTALVGSCIVEESFLENDFSKDQALIQEAEEWYESNLFNSNNKRKMSLINGNPVWGKSVTYIHNGKEVIEIPIRLIFKDIYSQKNKNFTSLSGSYRLLLFKINKDQFRPYILKAEMTSPEFKSDWKELKNLNLNTRPSTFNGKYMFFKLDGSYVGGWKIENGKRTRSNWFFKSSTSYDHTANSRVSDYYTYHCVVTTHTTYIEAGGGEPYIEEQYETWDCIFTPVFSDPDPSTPSGGGDGTPCYETLPDFEGHTVPCDETEPECPCCKVPPSERVLCEQQAPPCDDLPTYSIEIQNTAAWTGKNSGRYSATARKYRDGSPKPHWGLDIAANPGTPVFSIHSGEVVKVVSNIPPNKYIGDSFGNYVKIKSRNSNGEVFHLQYSHLNYVWVNQGDEIEKGQAIGLSGATGNAGDENVKKHVHIGATKLNSNNAQIKVNPENYIKFQYDSQGNVSFDPCNN
ncbi:M23 family metallopeptidase [Algoriphagus sp.]|uniref:M23 family metallopeptidase n=1 Tax=Algoriphagus sp. TaxID=1872435 RepID=UPI002624B4FF|nr:M23 family metallopeptidase [Algoriphagus sp.]